MQSPPADDAGCTRRAAKTPLRRSAPSWPRASGDCSSRLEAGFLVDGVDQVLADARLPSPCAPAAAPSSIAAFSLGVSVMISVLPDLRTASSASSFSFLAMSLAYFGRVLHRAFELGADVGRQAVPELLVDDHRIAQIAVVRTSSGTSAPRASSACRSSTAGSRCRRRRRSAAPGRPRRTPSPAGSRRARASARRAPSTTGCASSGP